jgi:tetratricopeptide (TPR) repeat protein
VTLSHVFPGNATAKIRRRLPQGVQYVNTYRSEQEPVKDPLTVPSPETQKIEMEAFRHCQAGRFLEAEKLYQKILSVDARHSDSLHMLGMIAHLQKRPLDALALIHRALALNEQKAQYRSSLGIVLQELNRSQEAIAEYKIALKLNPHHAETIANLAILLQCHGRIEEAAALYLQAITLKPDMPIVYNNLANILLSKGKLNEAESLYARALAVKPTYAEAYSNLGSIREVQGKEDEAMELHRKALLLKPDFPEANCNLGNILNAKGQPEKALLYYKQALALRPDYVDAHNGLGVALKSMGNLEEAKTCYERALALRPDYVPALYNLALSQLTSGDFVRAWPGYEWRWRSDNFAPERNFSQPQWRGEPLHGDRILLHAERGLGDTLQFLRYAYIVHEAGGKVILEVPAALRRLAPLLPCIEELVVSGEKLPDFSWHCPLMSLPLAFATAIDTIPSRIPYISIPQEAVNTAAKLPWPSKGLRVGVAWAGNPKHKRDRLRSIPLSLLEPILQLKGVEFFSLQVGDPTKQLAAINAQITDLAPFIADMADTAALIDRLDVVISVDTSVAHLAGALGKPVWLLLAYDADWRWLTGRENSPWYPTARLFRQRSYGDWAGVIERVAAALAQLTHPA